MSYKPATLFTLQGIDKFTTNITNWVTCITQYVVALCIQEKHKDYKAAPHVFLDDNNSVPYDVMIDWMPVW